MGEEWEESVQLLPKGTYVILVECLRITVCKVLHVFEDEHTTIGTIELAWTRITSFGGIDVTWDGSKESDKGHRVVLEVSGTSCRTVIIHDLSTCVEDAEEYPMIHTVQVNIRNESKTIGSDRVKQHLDGDERIQEILTLNLLDAEILELRLEEEVGEDYNVTCRLDISLTGELSFHVTMSLAEIWGVQIENIIVDECIFLQSLHVFEAQINSVRLNLFKGYSVVQSLSSKFFVVWELEII